MNALKDFLHKLNYRLMVIALIISFLLWLICMNFVDPETYEDYTLTLVLINEDVMTDSRKIIENKREIEGLTITAHVTGLKSELDKLVKNETIFAFIDLKDSRLIYAQEMGTEIPVSVQIGFAGDILPENYSINMLSPHSINIILDRIIDKPMILQIERIGDVPAGYIAMPTEQDITSVKISGPSSLITKITSLKVEVNLTDERSDISETLQIKAYNSFNEEITGISFDNEFVNIKIPVYKTGTLYVEVPEFIGEPQNGFISTKIDRTPRYIEVMGPAGDVEAEPQIILDAIDVTGISGTTYYNFDANQYLEKINREFGFNLKLVESAESEITAIVSVEAVITKELRIRVDHDILFTGIGFLSNRRITPQTEFVSLTIRGIEPIINAIDTITGTVDVLGLPDGDYELGVNFALPEGVEIIGRASFVSVNISTYAPEASNSPAPDSENEPDDGNEEPDGGTDITDEEGND